ncbi:hypothetical protein E1A91_A13G023800v1 [Gossypium mustelinum]|uniref:Uncharacterized protein n=1 Tax=Gossypium mustelinum TaxID=34275 RepID=A0A5D2WDG3_GOSMU|nr:hypothetical protein E1A91_A13G023800v1 [Gossypium mustelinum]
MATLVIQSHLKRLVATPVFFKYPPLLKSGFDTQYWVIQSVTEDKELASKKNSHSHEPKKLLFPNGSKTLKASSSEVGGGHGDDGDGHDDVEKLSSRAINASIVLGFDTFVVSKLLTIDHDYWHGWTLYEVLQYVSEHNWIAYEQALKAKPVIAKMAISGICYEGKPSDRALLDLLFIDPFLIIITILGFLRFESSANIYKELKATFWPMLTVRSFSSVSFDAYFGCQWLWYELQTM